MKLMHMNKYKNKKYKFNNKTKDKIYLIYPNKDQ